MNTTTTTTPPHFDSVAAIIEADKAAGFFFFSPGGMRFFQCRVSRELIGGRFFVTSEQAPNAAVWGGARRYTVREATAAGIDTVGEFQQHATRAQAIAAAKATAKAGALSLIECPAHAGAFDCTPFCRLCEGAQEYNPEPLTESDTP